MQIQKPVHHQPVHTSLHHMLHCQASTLMWGSGVTFYFGIETESASSFRYSMKDHDGNELKYKATTVLSTPLKKKYIAQKHTLHSDLVLLHACSHLQID